METFRSDMFTYVKRWTRMRPRKYKWCRDMLFSENLQVVACRGSYNIVETLVNQLEIMFETAHSWARVSKSTYSHVFFYSEHWLSFESVLPMFSDIVSCVKSWQRRLRKLKSRGSASIRGHLWKVMWKIRCYVLNVTHGRVFVSQKVCINTSRCWHICGET